MEVKWKLEKRGIRPPFLELELDEELREAIKILGVDEPNRTYDLKVRQGDYYEAVNFKYTDDHHPGDDEFDERCVGWQKAVSDGLDISHLQQVYSRLLEKDAEETVEEVVKDLEERIANALDTTVHAEGTMTVKTPQIPEWLKKTDDDDDC